MNSYQVGAADKDHSVVKLNEAIKNAGGRTEPRWTSNIDQDDSFLFIQYLLGTL